MAGAGLNTSVSTMPNTMPTLCMDGGISLATKETAIGCKFLTWKNLSQSIMQSIFSLAKCFRNIRRFDQLASLLGSNRLAATDSAWLLPFICSHLTPDFNENGT